MLTIVQELLMNKTFLLLTSIYADDTLLLSNATYLWSCSEITSVFFFFFLVKFEVENVDFFSFQEKKGRKVYSEYFSCCYFFTSVWVKGQGSAC